MLEDYFVKPQTIDRIRASWIGPEIERYVGWLSEHGYRARNVPRRVPVLVAFGEFARARGAGTVQDLPGHVEAFVAGRIARRARPRGDGVVSPTMAKEVRGPVEQMLAVVLPGFEGTGRRRRKQPFAGVLPGFFEYLAAERGLRPAAVESYRHHLDRFETYLTRVGVEVSEVSPALLSAFVTERSAAGLAKTTVREGCGVLRVFLRYAHREGVLGRDLSGTVEWPQAYRLATIPRSITWSEVDRVLGYVDRRTPCGRRDYAILLLLVIYGLRGREVAALRLYDIDWKRERRRALGRKYHSEESELRLLLRFAGERGAGRLDQLTPALLEEFLASRPRSRPRSFNHLLGVVACLMDWAVAPGAPGSLAAAGPPSAGDIGTGAVPV